MFFVNFCYASTFAAAVAEGTLIVSRSVNKSSSGVINLSWHWHPVILQNSVNVAFTALKLFLQVLFMQPVHVICKLARAFIAVAYLTYHS